MLGRPAAPRIETVNDLDCFIANFWRAVKADPDAVSHWADEPVNEADLHARHLWLVNRDEFREKMKTDPEYFDPKIAGWWVWGISCWIGSGWCSRPDWAGRINANSATRGVHSVGESNRNGRHSRIAGKQIWRKRPALRRGEHGVCRQIPDIGGDGSSGRGVHAPTLDNIGLVDWMRALSSRLRRVRVCCGDWSRILGRSPTECVGTTAVLLDPPYATDRDMVYSEDSGTVALAVREWALANGDNRKLRIALCGLEGEHDMPPDWVCVPWKANGGYGNTADGRGRANSFKERIWFSPHCLQPHDDLFAKYQP